MPIPFPEALWKKRNVETAGETEFSFFKKKAVNLVVVILNYLSLNRASRCPPHLVAGAPLSRLQWNMVKRLGDLLDGWICSGEVGPRNMGRAAPKIESLEDAIAALELQAESLRTESEDTYSRFCDEPTSGNGRCADVGRVVGTSSHAPYSTFKSLEPDRLQFVGFPLFDPLPYLDEESAAVYAEPLRMRRDPSEWKFAIPRVRMHCKPGDKIRLFELLDKSERLSLFPAREVDGRFASGMFAVVKSEERDRLIMDSRPANVLERPLKRWIRSLGSCEALGRLFLPPGTELRAFGSDLRDFYHLFQVGEERARRNILCGAVSPKDVCHLKCFREEFFAERDLFGALCTLAMGDAQAVSLAQTCHLSLALCCGAASPSNLLTLSGPVPREREMVGIIIDDFISLSIHEVGAPLPTPARSLRDRMERKYKEVKLISHPDTSFSDEVTCSFWGCDLDGKQGLIRGTLKRAIPLASLVLDIVRLGYSSVDLLQTIGGSLLSFYLFRRRMLCLMDLIFQATVGREKNEVLEMSGGLKSELFCLAFLLPLACTDLRALPRGRVFASDASNWGEASVVADLPGAISEELVRHSLRKGTWSRLLPAGLAWERSHGLLEVDQELPSNEICYTMNPLWETLAKCLSFRIFHKRRSKTVRRINVGELRSFLAAEKKAGIDSPGSRDLFGLDSQVCLGALLKGRSASPALNQEMERNLSDVLGLGLYSEFMYFSSKSNPSDDPTRGVPLRKACWNFPSWWEPLSRREFEGFDAWLRKEGLDSHTLSELPEFDELLGSIAQGEPDGGNSAASCCLGDGALASGHPPTSFQFSEGGFFERVQETIEQESDKLCERSRACFFGKFGPLGARESSEVFKMLEEWTSSGQLKRSDLGDENELIDRPGYLDLFSGIKGVAKWMQKLTPLWTVTFELEDGPNQNLDDERLRSLLSKFVAWGVFECWGAAPVCSSFSQAVWPRVRSLASPWGFEEGVSPSMQEKISRGNSCALWLVSLAELSLDLDVLFWIENPDTSYLFKLPPWVTLVEAHESLGSWRVDYCRFKAKWRKRTRFLSNSALRGHDTFCLGGHSHIVLRGRSSFHRKSWTSVAQAYPDLVSKTVCAGLAYSCGFLKTRGGFDPSCFAFTGTRRVGEAQKPGPPTRADRSLGLESVQLTEARTQALQSKIWRWFRDWCLERISAEAFSSAVRSPALLCTLVKEFGHFLFREGKSLYILRHLVVIVQKQIIGARPYIHICWDVVQRWEEVEPPTHRVPIPGSVVRAMASIAIHWRWWRFAGCILGAFYGIMRPGEILRAYRSDLILPADLLNDPSGPAFIRIRQPKSRRRGGGRVQHASIHDVAIVGLLDALFGSPRQDEALYPISPGSFRRRWDKIVEHLGIPLALKVTPGGLRAGGAVHEYRAGCDIPRLMWRMRVRHQHTLESYVQEVAADSFTAKLNPNCLRRITLMSRLFDFLLEVVAARRSDRRLVPPGAL